VKNLIIAIFIVVVCMPIMVHAGDVTLAWDANKESDLAGYRVFAREEGHAYDYLKPAWEGPETTCTVAVDGYEKDYQFVVRAYDTSGNESGDSNEVTKYQGPCEPCGLREVKQ
jgi:hypothetical protein